MKIYPEPAFFLRGERELEIQPLILPVFHGSAGSGLESMVSMLIDRFCQEELKPLCSESAARGKMPCSLHLDPQFVPGQISGRFLRDEAFSLTVGPDGIRIVSASRKGLIHGVNTLLEIFRTEAYAGKILAFSIQDAPAVPVRGVHLYLPSREDIPFFRRFVSRFLAPLHFNTVFLEVGGGMRFDRHPEINRGWEKFARWVFEHHARPAGPNGRFQDSAHAELAGGSFLEKDEVRSLAEWTRSCGLEVIPEIPSLTHAYYLAAGHREIAELPEALWPDAYCPSNPLSREILFDVMDEYIEAIRPGMVHIGHDEWRAPALCPKCGNRAPELFAEDVCAIHRHLADRNIRTAMWADGLLPFGDGTSTWTCIDSIPNDIFLLHWGWQFGDFLDRLSARGFRMILGNFNAQMTDAEWEKNMADPNMLGAEISSWVGMNRNRFAVDGTVWQMLYGANYLWRGRKLRLEDADAMASELLPQIAGSLEETPSPSCCRGTVSVPVDLSSVLYVVSLVKSDAMEWAVDSLKPGYRKWRNVNWVVPDPWQCGNKKCVLAARPSLSIRQEKNTARSIFSEAISFDSETYPEKIRIPLARKVKGLLFFHFASKSGLRKNMPYQTVDEPDPLEWCSRIGCYRICHASGAEEVIDLHLGLNIDDFKSFYGDRSKFPLLDAPAAVRIDSLSGFPAGAIGGLEWRNPRPDDEIVWVEMTAVSNQADTFPVLSALSALE